MMIILIKHKKHLTQIHLTALGFSKSKQKLKLVSPWKKEVAGASFPFVANGLKTYCIWYHVRKKRNAVSVPIEAKLRDNS